MFADIFSYLGEHPSILVVIFFIYCFIYALSFLFSGPKPGKNPLGAHYIKPPKAVVTDHNLRNKVLKQRFKLQKVPDDLDAIVIGSGIGGLSTAVLLSRAGQKVLVLEQHDQAGGCCHSFVDKGFEFDTGIHYVGQMMDGAVDRVLTDQITEGQVVWAPMEDVFDRVAIGPSSKPKVYTMLAGSYQKFAENLERQFPTEKEAIKKYIKLVQDCHDNFYGMIYAKVLPKRLVQFLVSSGIYSLVMRKYTQLCQLSAKQALDQISDNEQFKNVMYYIFGDMGIPPSKLGVLGYGTLINYFIPGSYYPRGGTSEIALQIVPIIERYGGRVLVDAPVTNILVNDNGRVHGVRVHKPGGDVDIFAKRVISDAGVVNTFKYMLPQEIATKAPMYRFIDKVGPSGSFISVFIGIDGSQKDLKLHTSNTWAFTGLNLEEELQSFTSLPLEEAVDRECPLMFISFPSAKDPSWEDKYPGKSAALIITLAPWSWFTQWKDTKLKHRGDDYEALKMRLAHQMWRQCEQLFPQLEGKMEYIDIGTPLSNKYYLGQPEGEMYGLDHNKSRFRPEVAMQFRAESGIPGLYLTGQDIMTCGFSSALTSGYLTAGTILHRNLFGDLKSVMKELERTARKKKTQ